MGAKVVFFGLGSIGQRHLRIMRENWPEFDIFSFNSSKKIDGVVDLKTMDQFDYVNPDYAFVCNPTYLHLSVCMLLISRNIRIFLEKPIDCSLKFLDYVENNENGKVFVGYPFLLDERFDIIKNMSYAEFICHTNIDKWVKPYGLLTATGGGAMLELSHEIYLAQHCFGEVEQLSGDITWRRNLDVEARVYMLHNYGKVSAADLSIRSEYECRRVRSFSSSYNVNFDYNISDDIYKRQLEAFFGAEKLYPFSWFSGLFRKIIKFRESVCRY